jgi:gamma-glutamyltranspeptidase/glutathione hydrolase
MAASHAGVGAASSTSARASVAAMQALHAEPGQPAGTAVDGLVAGVLALAASRAEVLLGAATILLGGTGEGLHVVDGRARQPGLDAPRPRGFVEGAVVPDAAGIAAPGLPSALALAHAGRGERTLLELARLAVADAKGTEKSRVDAIVAFGRSGTAFLRTGAIRDALLSACARSLGGVLTAADLDDAARDVIDPQGVELGARTWSVAPWTSLLDEAPGEARDEDASPSPVEIVAVVDGRGTFALAAVVVAARSLALEGVGLAAPLLAEPVRRGIPRVAPGKPLPMSAPIALSRRRERSAGDFGGIDLGLGVGGSSDAPRTFAELARAVSVPTATFDDALAKVPPARGVAFDGRRARPLKGPDTA